MATINSMAAAERVCGTLGFPSKMPGTSYGTPARACIIGSKLRQVLNSTCAKCYAFERGNYQYSSVRKSQETRLLSLENAQWCEAIAYALLKAHGHIDRRGRVHKKSMRKYVHKKIAEDGVDYHRWHDSGDLQSLAHLIRIVLVCQMTPMIRHWLPTREVGIVAAFLKGGGTFPENLCVRLSATMIDGAPSKILPTTSTVHDKAPARGFSCPAPRQGNKCGPCRACWSNDNANTSYHVH
jgi:hypothetical protein